MCNTLKLKAKIRTNLKLLEVRQTEIVKIAALISVLVNFQRTVYFFKSGKFLIDNFSGTSIRDILFNLIFSFIFPWFILQLNANWTYRFLIPKPLKLLATIIVNIGILLGSILLFKALYAPLVGERMPIEEIRFLDFKFGVIFIITFFIARILRLQVNQRQSLLENELLKQQNLQNELTALRNQINPHFLFNSLNTLNSLVRENKEATQFINKLSYMYRYILQSGDRDMVSVAEELKFLESYSYLIKTRYRDRFELDIALDKEHLKKEIPPLALQVLVENAVKHNEISEEHPLKVNIFYKDNYIHVENAIRPRTYEAEGTGNGLLNLEKRYALLGKQKVLISNHNAIFSVRLPLNNAL